jgi:LysM repeat protein
MTFMNRRITAFLPLLIGLLAGSAVPGQDVLAAPDPVSIPAEVSRWDLILAMNTLRVSNGYPALIEDPIVSAVAQSTAEIMAANQMSWHIGDVRGRIAAAGYGGGATVWATENFAVGTTMGIDQIMLAWADPDHMRPVTNPAYCHVGAGVAAAANGRIYYVLQAAYVSGSACGEYISPDLPDDGGSSDPAPISQVIVPVQVATPDDDGSLYHTVLAGQTFWAIAIAYQVTIADIEFWNNLSREFDLQVGQLLLIPTSSTTGFATATARGFVLPSLPDEDGRIVHEVKAYQTLSTIAAAYQVSLDSLLLLNGWQTDWPLQIGQELLIDAGNISPTVTPRPLTPIERLTPASDGRYYHTVSSGETLSGIAVLYEISVDALVSWNGLSSAAIIQPGQALLLQITPPASATATPAPASATPTPLSNPVEPTQTPTSLATATVQPTRQTPVVAEQSSEPDTSAYLIAGIVLLLFLVILGLGLRSFRPPISG